MARTIICPVGLSIFQGEQGLQRLNVPLSAGHEHQQVRSVLESLGDQADSLSAELATLKRLAASREDEVVFLATDTDDGERAARVNVVISKARFGVAASPKRVSGLVLDDATRFRREGIPQLVQAIDRHVSNGLERGSQPLLSVSGGIKPVVPYVALYGMLRGVRIAYTFERTGDLIFLPPLPISFDWSAVALAGRALGVIDREATIKRDRLTALLGEECARLEALFEEEAGEVTLSAFGLLLLENMRTAVERAVLLSPSARKKLETLQGGERAVVEAMLDKVRNPLVREHKKHPFSGTDLDVYKPGRTRQRLAYWVEGPDVRIAEIYTDHDEYERDLSGRRKSHYDQAQFVTHRPTEQMVEEDLLADETVAIALRDLARAEQERGRASEGEHRALAERNDALELGAELENQLTAARTVSADRQASLDELNRRAEELQRRVNGFDTWRRDISSWNWWRRVRAAVLGPWPPWPPAA